MATDEQSGTSEPNSTALQLKLSDNRIGIDSVCASREILPVSGAGGWVNGRAARYGGMGWRGGGTEREKISA